MLSAIIAEGVGYAVLLIPRRIKQIKEEGRREGREEARAEERGRTTAAERAIGRSKTRHKTVRGCKSESGLLNWFGLTQRAWSGLDGLELSEPVAAQGVAHPPRGIAPSEIRPDFPNSICDGYPRAT